MRADHEKIQELLNIKDKHAENILKKPGVTGIAVGHKVKSGKVQEEISVIVYVKKKLPLADIHKDDVISIQDVSVDIQEAGEMTAHWLARKADEMAEQNSASYDPLVGGIEIGPMDDHFVGTLGAILFNHADGALVGLTNWHVAAGSAANPLGRTISQPGNGALAGVGTCAQAVRGETIVGAIDAASIALNGRHATPLEVAGIGPIRGMSQASVGEQVIKRGRTTDITTGIITALAWTGDVNYDGTLVRFTNQIFIQPAPGTAAASLPGDSGSIWLANPGHSALGLNFAGDGKNAIANPIFAVLHNLNVQFEPNRHTLYRWFNRGNGDHFYTQDPGGELAPIGGYIYEGAPQALVNSSEPSATALFRWYNPASGDHFYTTDPTGELAPQAGYHSEGIAGHIRMSPAPGMVQWYRWYNPNSGDHFYTTDPHGELAPTAGYKPEGVVGWVTPQ